MRGPEAFDQYYRCQGLVADDRAWAEFKSRLTSPLPITFTIVRDFPGGLGQQLLARIADGHLPDLRPIRWYPGGVSFQTTTADDVVKAQTEAGTVIRQELVRSVASLCR